MPMPMPMSMQIQMQMRMRMQMQMQDASSIVNAYGFNKNAHCSIPVLQVTKTGLQHQRDVQVEQTNCVQVSSTRVF